MKTRNDSLNGGEKFHRLTVVDYSHTSTRRDGGIGERIMNCLCECGTKIKVKTSNLKSGNTKSCGCYHSDQTVESNKARADVENINDHFAYVCDCGSVNFSLLKSGSIECNGCSKPTGFNYLIAEDK